MLRVILYILFFFVFYSFVRLLLKLLFGPRKDLETEAGPEELVQDPYCLTYLSKRVAFKKKISGKDTYFCKEECMKKYLEARGSSKI